MIEFIKNRWSQIITVWESVDLGLRFLIIFLVIFSIGHIIPDLYFTYTFWEKNSESIRNLGLVIAAIPGLGLLWWRTVSANSSATSARRQASMAGEQAGIALRQVKISMELAELAQKGHLTDRFSKAVELMGHDKSSIQVGGILALEQVAKEDLETYYETVYELLCAFVRDRAPIAKMTARNEPQPPPSLAVQTALTVIGRREEGRNVKLDLSKTNLREISLIRANLNKVNLNGTCLSKACLSGASLNEACLVATDLVEADFFEADFLDARFVDAKLQETILFCANISGADFNGVENLTQKQITSACANPDNQPKGLPDHIKQMPPPCEQQ